MHYKTNPRSRVQSNSFFLDELLLAEVAEIAKFYHQSISRIIECAIQTQRRGNDLHQAKKRSFKKAQKIHPYQNRPKRHRHAGKKKAYKQECLPYFVFAAAF